MWEHKQIEEALPDGFHSVISRLVIPMKPKKRHRRAVTTSVLISAEVIFSRIVGYLNSGKFEVTIVVALETELGPIPVALVDEKKGCVLRSMTKTNLKDALLVQKHQSQGEGRWTLS